MRARAILFSVVTWAALALTPPARTAEPPKNPAALKNVTDYYLALPQSVLGVGGPGPAERRRLIDTEDLNNGYLHLSGGDWEGHGEVVLWRKPDKSFLLGLSIAHCGPVCGQHLRFFVHRDGAFKDVTAEVWTPLPEAEIETRYKKAAGKKFEDGGAPPTLVRLPRKGTSLELVTQEEFTDGAFTLAVWAFKDGRFVLGKEPPPGIGHP